jgi:Dickkopf-like protein
MRRTLLLLSTLGLGWGGCVVHADSDYDCGDESYDCYVEYSPDYGYSRVCDVVVDPVVCIDFSDDDAASQTHYRHRSAAGGANGSAGSSNSGGSYATAGAGGTSALGEAGSSGLGGSAAAPGGTDAEGFDFPCERDAQCGTGLCIEGECFYGCVKDTDCGTADICALLNDVSVCQTAEDPAINCMRNAECGFEQVCLNASCHDSCSLTSDCSNELDRCVAGVCVPDRRVVSECLLDRECAAGEVCIDATCQPL